MSDSRGEQPDTATTTLQADLYCLNCGYNLRGLAGDPVRCPECGTRFPRATLLGTERGADSRRRELQSALDVCVIIILVSVGGVIIGEIAPVCAIAALPLGIIGLSAALSEVRRVCYPRREWFRDTCAYLGWTCAIATIVPAIWAAGGVATWSVLGLEHTGHDPMLPAICVGGVVSLVVVGVFNPFPALRRRQRAPFDRLFRYARARVDADAEGPLRDPSATASLTPAMRHDSLFNILQERFAAAVAEVAGTEPGEIDPVLRPAGDPKFGDYQCNVAMSLARPLKAKPRDIAQRIVDAVDLEGIAGPLEIAGPGFINIRLTDEFLAGYLGEIPAPVSGGAQSSSLSGGVQSSSFALDGHPSEDKSTGGKQSRSFALPDRLGMPPVEHARKVVIDYSSPNIAKQMHVGHLRSTIIGDVFARVLMFEGHEVIRQNHVGDWGTQFGMLIAYYADHPIPTPETHGDVLDAIEDDYRAAQERFQSDPEFAATARAAVGKLQGGDPDARQTWEQLCAASRGAFTSIYHRLNVLLEDGDVCGESFYNDRLAPTVTLLRETLPLRDKTAPADTPYAELREDAGAQCIFLYDEQHEPLFKKPDGEEMPMIIQKSDGAFLYATTDLAAIRYRTTELGCDRLIYVTDARQKLHFETLFAAVRAAGWAGADISLEHATFGSVQGADRKPLKTREGKNIKLSELLDEAEKRALELLETKSDEATERRSDEGSDNTGPSFSAGEKREIARRVGIAAVKYADLRNDRVSDYVFSWDKMLAMQGNTAPYMMYAYARIRSIYRKAAERFGEPDVYGKDGALGLSEPAERALALKLARLRETIDAIAAELQPHVLCTYLYEVASEFMRFYESCPVLKAPDDATRLSRMRLCDLTARTLRLGLGLLGIETIERM